MAYQLPRDAVHMGFFKRFMRPNHHFPLYRLPDGRIVNNQGIDQNMQRRGFVRAATLAEIVGVA